MHDWHCMSIADINGTKLVTAQPTLDTFPSRLATLALQCNTADRIGI